MDMKKRKELRLALFIGLILSLSLSPNVTSWAATTVITKEKTDNTEEEETESVGIDLYGHWRKGAIDDRSDYPPITAYIESSILYIQLDKLDGDLDIAIVSGKSGRVVWNQVYPETTTSLVAIPLDALPAGEYSLQVVNEWGGYLCSTFKK